MRSLIALLPVEVAPLMFAAAGLAMIVGARKVAAALAISGLAIVVLPVALEPLFAQLPNWLLLIMMPVLLIAIGLAIVKLMFKGLIGQRAWDHMVGILAADFVRGAIVAFFGGLCWAIRLPGRAILRLLRLR